MVYSLGNFCPFELYMEISADLPTAVSPACIPGLLTWAGVNEQSAEPHRRPRPCIATLRLSR